MGSTETKAPLRLGIKPIVTIQIIIQTVDQTVPIENSKNIFAIAEICTLEIPVNDDRNWEFRNYCLYIITAENNELSSPFSGPKAAAEIIRDQIFRHRVVSSFYHFLKRLKYEFIDCKQIINKYICVQRIQQ